MRRGGNPGSRRASAAPAGSASGGPDREALLSVRALVKSFAVTGGPLRRVVGTVRAVDGVTFTLRAGETLGLVGESGSGKTTIGRLVLRLIEPSGGAIDFDGTDLLTLDRRSMRGMRRHLQIVFQDPYSSLDPRATVGASVAEPLEIHEGLRGRDRDAEVERRLAQVGLEGSVRHRYPHEFSGGQRQRIAIARALATDPKLVVCDEPVSALDVSTQSQVINLLGDLQDHLGVAYLFIAHDLSLVRHVSHRIAVAHLGRIVEVGDAEEVYERPTHPYTEALLSAIPLPDPVVQRRRHRIVLHGDPPSPLAPPPGCGFHPRCPYVMPICRSVEPPAFRTAAGTTVHCHLHLEGPRLEGAPVTGLRARPGRDAPPPAPGTPSPRVAGHPNRVAPADQEEP